MQVYLGSLYANDFNRFGRTYQVNVQADQQFRLEPEQIEEIFRRKPDGQSGIGIKNVNDRLNIWFGDAYGITIESVPDEGTKVTVRMPKVREEAEHEKH